MSNNRINDEKQLLNKNSKNQERVGVEFEDEFLAQKDQQQFKSTQQKDIENAQNQIHQEPIQTIWKPYYMSKKSPSKLVRFFHSWYKIRDKLTRPFNYKLPFFRRSAGMVIIMILLLAAIVPVSYARAFGGSSNRRHGGNDKVAKWVPTAFLTSSFVFATRNSIPGFILGMSYENQLVMHKFLSYMAVITGWFHGIDELIHSHEPISDFSNVSGLVLLIAMSVLVVKGILFKWIQTFFNTFLTLHWLLFIVVLVFAVLHGAAAATIIGGGAFLLDFILRSYLMLRYKKLTKICQIKNIAQRVVEISFDKKGEAFHYDAGQYAFLVIPDISIYAMHPFSIQSCPYEEKVSFYIKNIGSYTEKIRLLAQKKEQIKVYVHGPYGYPQIEIEGNRFQYFVMFSGGIGVTAMQSFAKSLLYEKSIGRPLRKIIFCWTGREADFLDHVVNVRKFDRELEQKNPQYCSAVHMIVNLTTKNLEPEILAQYKQSVNHEIHQGRMDIKQILQNCQKEAACMGLKRIGVLSCGPHSMLQRVNFLASTLSGKEKVKIEYHREIFSFLTEVI